MEHYRFLLYVTRLSHRVEFALEGFRRACDEELDGRYELVVINVLDQPEAADAEKVLATPTLIKEFPLPKRRVTGDFSDPVRVLDALGVVRGELRNAEGS